MILRLKGVNVTGGRAAGRLAFAYDHEAPIVFASTMTPRVAHDAVMSGAAAILTKYGSFVCHGANVLRELCRRVGREVVWVTGIDDNKLTPSRFTYAAVSDDGTIVLSTGISDVSEPAPPTCIQRSFIAQKPHAVAAFSAGHTSRCYWPDRQYDVLLASIMIPALRADVERLAGQYVDVEHRSDGRIWFGPGAPSVSAIAKFVTQHDTATRMLTEQASLYEALINILRAAAVADRALSAVELLALLRLYYANFLPFHDTYEIVLATLASSIQGRISARARDIAFDVGTSSLVVRWLTDRSPTIDIRKDILTEDPIIDVPPCSPVDDLTTTLEHLRQSSADINLPQPSDDMTLVVSVLVVKEWKFIVNRLLFTRFAAALRQKLVGDNLRRARHRPVDEVLRDLAA